MKKNLFTLSTTRDISTKAHREDLTSGSHAGMTLLEIMLSLSVIAITVVTVLQVFLYSARLTETNQSIAHAMTEAGSILEEISASDFSSITNNYGSIATGPTLYRSSSMGNEGLGIISIDDSNPDLLQIEVQVHWNEGYYPVGEDRNLNGILDAGEDIDGNNVLNSPATITTFLSESF